MINRSVSPIFDHDLNDVAIGKNVAVSLLSHLF